MTTFLFSLLMLATPWRQTHDAGDITVWERDVPGYRVREVKAQAIVKASAERVRDVLADVEHYPEFMPYLVKNAKITGSSGAHYEYERIEPPLIAPRDYTVKVVVEDDATLRIYRRTWTEANEHSPVPETRGVVRVALNRGGWTVEALTNDEALLTYVLHTDPVGDLPVWIVNKASTQSLPDLMRAVSKRAIDPRWRR